MEKPWNWVRTLVAQLALCFALFLALQLGRPQKSLFSHRSESRPRDLYFISVRGGFRPVNQQTHLLKQGPPVRLSLIVLVSIWGVPLLEKVATTYKARFVVTVSELGEDDPLVQNATRLVPSLKIPWYTTRVSKVHEEGGSLLEQVNVSYGKSLDIIGVNTGLIQDMLMEPLKDAANNQLNWLTRTLEAKAASDNWCIVVGFHPLYSCEERDEETEVNQVFETLWQTFMKFEVNAYISGQDCIHQGSISYTENPGSNVKGPHLSSSNGRSVFTREVIDGFLLHRVSALELVTYSVTSAGEVVHRTALQQRGKEVM
ncbi:hypothetical protein TIFTF001_026042 [Ficus carica]|uniref:Calcineurin-like phosphoesterase domain-containing protein n=1 Tax=Ficus carica TaxID=3494 RepID=A0AA88AZC7_FICCA|nr:hypothetical protein TIFTF001_026042 [Ficus carica]